MQKRINLIKHMVVILCVLSVSCVGGRLVKTKIQKMPNGTTHKYTYYIDRDGNVVVHGKYRKISTDERYIETVYYDNGQIVGTEFYTVDRDPYEIMIQRKK